MNQVNYKSFVSLVVGTALVSGATISYQESGVLLHALQGSHTSIYGLNEQQPIIQVKEVKSSKEITSWLKEEGLPIAIIANILKVERKTIYAWLEGVAAKDHNQERLEEIYKLLSEGKQADLRNLYRLWNREITPGISLNILFSQEQLDDATIKKVLREFWPTAKKYMDWNKSNSANNKAEKNPILEEMPAVSPIRKT